MKLVLTVIILEKEKKDVLFRYLFHFLRLFLFSFAITFKIISCENVLFVLTIFSVFFPKIIWSTLAMGTV